LYDEVKEINEEREGEPPLMQGATSTQISRTRENERGLLVASVLGLVY
jgi:hypothetical protein